MDEAPRRRPTLADVARRSEVSTATVSYILNNRVGQTISLATRTRVLAAAAELDYRPNASAQALAGGRSRIVVIDMSDIPSGVLVDAAAIGIAAAFERRGFLPVIDRHSAARPGHALLIALCQMIVPSAVVTLQPLPAEVADELRAAGVAIVTQINSPSTGVLGAIADAAEAQAEHLVAHGHRRIGYLPTAVTELASLDTRRREALGARLSLLGAETVDLPRTTDPAELAETLRADRSVTAIAAYNDEVALVALAAAYRAGLRVPEDLAVIGVDDQPVAALAIPPLTTVAITPTIGPSSDELVEAVLADAVASLPIAELHVAVVERASV